MVAAVVAVTSSGNDLLEHGLQARKILLCMIGTLKAYEVLLTLFLVLFL